MRRATPLLLAAAVAIAGCGGALAMPDGGDTWTDCPSEVTLQPATGMACRYLLPLPPPSDCDWADRMHIGVKVAGNEIARDPNRANGWDYTDDTMDLIEVYGPSCDAITANPALPVSIVFKMLIP